MEYFYTPQKHIAANSLTIVDDEFSHLTHVMRKSVGDDILVVDGVGTAYQTTIEEIGKRTARCAIRNRFARLHEPPVDVTLAVGILKNPSRFDVLVEKATELGVNRIVPLLTERTIPRHAKADRWQKIALAAMKQSGRCVLPVVEPLTQFLEFITNVDAEVKIIPHEKSGQATFAPAASTTVAICIGPEGGFSENEIAMASDAGFAPVSLGERRLRTETAAVVAVATLLMH